MSIQKLKYSGQSGGLHFTGVIVCMAIKTSPDKYNTLYVYVVDYLPMLAVLIIFIMSVLYMLSLQLLWSSNTEALSHIGEVHRVYP